MPGPRRGRPPLPDGPFLVVGIARSGEAVATALAARGERVIAADARPPGGAALDAAAGRLRAAGVEVHLNVSDERLAADVRTLVKSPGVPHSAGLVVAARAAGATVAGELEIAWRLLPNDFIAVTGTNGKTTTTEWIAHVHRCAAAPVVAAGNVGTALSSLVGELDDDVTVVCEASSFQLEDSVEFAPEAAVLLNITPDHLDRHGSFERYRDAKLRIFKNQTATDLAVLSEELAMTLPADGIQTRLGAGTAVRFGVASSSQLRSDGRELSWNGEPLIDLDGISLPGAHNLQNAMATAAVCLARGLDAGAVAQGLASFAGVAHRLELVASGSGISYVNDSKATNVASTQVALESYSAGVHLILGGQGKGQDFAPLAALVAQRATAVYLIGEDAALIAAALAGSGVPAFQAGTLEQAVKLAGDAARPGEVVLLSPACASYDQFQNFEERGDRFRELALAAAGRDR